MALSKPTLGVNTDYAARIGLLFDAFNALEPVATATAWTPVLTFATPGNLVVAYSAQVGRYYRLGPLVFVDFAVTTSTFTHTTASGALRITGLPVAAASDGTQAHGSLQFQGITKASYTQFNPRVEGGNAFITFVAGASAVGPSAVAAADMPTAGTVFLIGSVIYRA